MARGSERSAVTDADQQMLENRGGREGGREGSPEEEDWLRGEFFVRRGVAGLIDGWMSRDGGKGKRGVG